MKLLALLVSFALFVPSADAAIIRSTKQKNLPVIANVRVDTDLEGVSFDVKKAPTLNSYDVWARLTNSRKRVTAEWFLGSMKFRTRGAGAVKEATFGVDLGDILAYSRGGAYELTIFACASNLKKPNAVGCANALTTIEYRTRTAAD